MIHMTDYYKAFMAWKLTSISNQKEQIFKHIENNLNFHKTMSFAQKKNG